MGMALYQSLSCYLRIKKDYRAGELSSRGVILSRKNYTIIILHTYVDINVQICEVVDILSSCAAKLIEKYFQGNNRNLSIWFSIPAKFTAS